MTQILNKFNFFFIYSYYFSNLFPKFVNFISTFQTNLNLLNLSLNNSIYLLDLAMILRFNTNFRFQCLIDVSAIDYPFRIDSRFTVYYLFSSYSPNPIRAMLQVSTSAIAKLDSMTKYFDSANWLERELYDMFGIYFVNHPDLRRILTDYGFEGFPLRKDFPLTGYFEIRYDEEVKKILVEPVTVIQSFRNFEFTSPWRLYN